LTIEISHVIIDVSNVKGTFLLCLSVPKFVKSLSMPS